MNKSTAWKESKLRRILSSHVLGKIKASTKDAQQLTKIYMSL